MYIILQNYFYMREPMQYVVGHTWSLCSDLLQLLECTGGASRGLPRDTYTYLDESFFSDSLSPLRNDIKGFYIKFIHTNTVLLKV